MKVVLCGSMQFAEEMLKIASKLEQAGHNCFVSSQVTKYTVDGAIYLQGEDTKQKIEHDAIRAHCQLIEQADAILVLNYTKRQIENYIGGNSFLEMGYAYALNKRIYLLNPIPDIAFYQSEMVAMQPIVLNGDLSLINAGVEV